MRGDKKFLETKGRISAEAINGKLQATLDNGDEEHIIIAFDGWYIALQDDGKWHWGFDD